MLKKGPFLRAETPFYNPQKTQAILHKIIVFLKIAELLAILQFLIKNDQKFDHFWSILIKFDQNLIIFGQKCLHS